MASIQVYLKNGILVNEDSIEFIEKAFKKLYSDVGPVAMVRHVHALVAFARDRFQPIRDKTILTNLIQRGLIDRRTNGIPDEYKSILRAAYTDDLGNPISLHNLQGSPILPNPRNQLPMGTLSAVATQTAPTQKMPIAAPTRKRRNAGKLPTRPETPPQAITPTIDQGNTFPLHLPIYQGPVIDIEATVKYFKKAYALRDQLLYKIENFTPDWRNSDRTNHERNAAVGSGRLWIRDIVDHTIWPRKIGIRLKADDLLVLITPFCQIPVSTIKLPKDLEKLEEFRRMLEAQRIIDGKLRIENSDGSTTYVMHPKHPDIPRLDHQLEKMEQVVFTGRLAEMRKHGILAFMDSTGIPRPPQQPPTDHRIKPPTGGIHLRFE